MKILMINSVCGIGSTGKICTDLAQELEKRGHIVKIAYGRYSVPEEFNKYAVRISTEFEVRLHALRARIFDAMGFGSIIATKRFLVWVKKFNPDIIHLHNIHGYYINIELLFRYLKSSGKRIIWTLHDCWSFTGHCSHFEYVDCLKWSSYCKNCEQLKEYPTSLLIDRSNYNFEKKKELFTGIPNLMIVVPSNWLREKVEASFLKDYPCLVINNGINKQIFKEVKSDIKQRYGLESKKILLGVASTWTKRKGLDDYILLSKLLKNSNYRIVLIGVNKKQKEILKPIITGILKTRNQLELIEWYSVADYFVNLTLEDTYPTVNLEARACGVPIITYDTGGSPESAGNNAIIVKKHDLENIVYILLNKERKKETFNMKVQDIRDMIDSYIKLYK